MSTLEIFDGSSQHSLQQRLRWGLNRPLRFDVDGYRAALLRLKGPQADTVYVPYFAEE